KGRARKRGRANMNSLAAFSVMLVVQAPQHGVLIDAASANGGKTVSSVDVHYPKPTFDTVAKASNLIVAGRVGHVTTRFSEDGNDVPTEFTIIPSKVYKGSAGDVVKTPGPTKPLIVRRLGGTVIVDGLQLTTDANQYPETESLREGEDVLLFLNRNANTGNCG